MNSYERAGLMLESVLINEHNGFSRQEFMTLLENNTPEKNKSLVDNVVTEVFRSVKKKSLDNIDLKDIKLTKGDITKLPEYNDLYNASMFLFKGSQQTSSRELIEITSTITNVITSLKNYSSNFYKAYSEKNILLTLLYENVALALIHTLGRSISLCVEIYKDSYNITRTKLTEENSKTIMKSSPYNTLKSFNQICKDGNINVVFKNLTKENSSVLNESFIGDLFTILGKNKSGNFDFKSLVMAIGKTFGVIVLVLEIIRNASYYFFTIRLKVAVYLEQIANYAEIEANESTDEKTRQKLEKKVEKLRDLANRINVDSTVAEKKKEDEEKKDNEEISKKIKNKTTDEENSNSSSSSSSNNNVGITLY